MKYAKITSSIWGTLEDTIVTGHEMGEIMMWDMRKKTNESLLRIRPHSKKVMDLQKDKEGTCFVSASKDYTAKVNRKPIYSLIYSRYINLNRHHFVSTS